MSKKKKLHAPAKPPQFRATPFNSLKGVIGAKPVEIAPPTKELAPLPVEEDGAALFLEAMEGVKKLHGTTQGQRKNAASGQDKRPENLPPSPSPAEREAADLFLEEIGRLKLEVRFSEASLDEDDLKPLSGNRLRQLKRGIITVDHQLDLHGLTRDEALEALPRFLQSACLRGQTAALVITGKGNHSPAEPVLQQAVASWLRDAGRELVVEFTPAPREMGGSGAFVVFLRPVSPTRKPASKPA